MRTLKRYFISGLAVFTPFVLTSYVCFWVLNFAEGIFGKYLRAFLLDKYDFYVWGIGIIVLVILILISGFFITNYFGRAVHRITEKFMLKIPLMGSIYPAFKEIAGFLFQEESESSKLGQVVLVEWPRPGVFTLGFLTNETPKFIADKTGLEMVNVLIPTVPNPISGFLAMFRRDQIQHLDMTVEEAVKMIVSGGVVDPRGSVQNEK